MFAWIMSAVSNGLRNLKASCQEAFLSIDRGLLEKNSMRTVGSPAPFRGFRCHLVYRQNNWSLHSFVFHFNPIEMLTRRSLLMLLQDRRCSRKWTLGEEREEYWPISASLLPVRMAFLFSVTGVLHFRQVLCFLQCLEISITFCYISFLGVICNLEMLPYGRSWFPQFCLGRKIKCLLSSYFACGTE